MPLAGSHAAQLMSPSRDRPETVSASAFTSYLCFFFFFQAEDGIRDLTVTGVQTCALPILLRHLLSDPEYGTLRAGLRMNVIGNPGVEKTDFELWSLAVSAINGCGQCLDSHEQVLRKAGVDRETVQEAFKIAAVVQAVGTTLDAEATPAADRRRPPA